MKNLYFISTHPSLQQKLVGTHTMCQLGVKAVSLNTTVTEDEFTLCRAFPAGSLQQFSVPLYRYANSDQAQAHSLHCGRDGSEQGWALARAGHEVSWWHWRHSSSHMQCLWLLHCHPQGSTGFSIPALVPTHAQFNFSNTKSYTFLEYPHFTE